MSDTMNLIAVNAVEYTNPETEKRDNVDAGDPFTIDAEVGESLKSSGAARDMSEAEEALFEKQAAAAAKSKKPAAKKAAPAKKAAEKPAAKPDEKPAEDVT